MSRNTKTSPPLYNTIVDEREREVAFAAWREKVTLFKTMFNGAGMALINRKFRPWKAPGLKRKERYKRFLQYYKFYYVSKKVMRDVLNELIFRRSLRGDELSTMFADSLIQFDSLSKMYAEPQKNDQRVESNPDSPKETSLAPSDDKPAKESNDMVDEERSSSGDSLGTPGHESNWNYSDGVSYDSDDVYDTNMYPGYGRSPRASAGPTFTYSKTA